MVLDLGAVHEYPSSNPTFLEEEMVRIPEYELAFGKDDRKQHDAQWIDPLSIKKGYPEVMEQMRTRPIDDLGLVYLADRVVAGKFVRTHFRYHAQKNPHGVFTAHGGVHKLREGGGEPATIETADGLRYVAINGQVALVGNQELQRNNFFLPELSQTDQVSGYRAALEVVHSPRPKKKFGSQPTLSGLHKKSFLESYNGINNQANSKSNSKVTATRSRVSANDTGPSMHRNGHQRSSRGHRLELQTQTQSSGDGTALEHATQLSSIVSGQQLYQRHHNVDEQADLVLAEHSNQISSAAADFGGVTLELKKDAQTISGRMENWEKVTKALNR